MEGLPQADLATYVSLEGDGANVVSVGDQQTRFDRIHLAQNAAPFVDCQTEAVSADALERTSRVQAKVRTKQVIAFIDIWRRGETLQYNSWKERGRVNGSGGKRSYTDS